MNRRSAIQQLVIISAGTALLPSCGQGGTTATTNTLTFKHLTINPEQQDMLATLTQAIIPSTSSIGAKEIKSHEFALKMIDDCSSPEDQQKFMRGLEQFDELTQKKYGDSFSAIDKNHQNEFLHSLEDKKNTPEEVTTFYRTVKNLTLQSYTGSEYYMTTVMKYNIIPKKYKGCVSVKH